MPPGARLFPVGRLDTDTSGLIVLTNDGELAHHLMHPRYGVDKLYRVRVEGVPDARQLRRMREGVALEAGSRTSRAEVRVRRMRSGHCDLDIAIHEGRYRQVRRMCQAVGLTVKALHRWGYGTLRLGDLPVGACRSVTATEVAHLKAAAARPEGDARPMLGLGLHPVSGARSPGGRPVGASQRSGRRRSRRSVVGAPRPGGRPVGANQRSGQRRPRRPVSGAPRPGGRPVGASQRSGQRGPRRPVSGAQRPGGRPAGVGQRPERREPRPPSRTPKSRTAPSRPFARPAGSRRSPVRRRHGTH